jgi:mannobiose 2-epimerase
MATGFALYGIATYAQHVASPAEKSAVLAILKETYTSVEYLYNKDVGAYEGEGAMTYDRPGDVEKYVSANLLMHMIEALTPMCLVAPTVTEYKERLSRLVDFVFNKLYVTTGGGFLTDYAFTGYDNKDVSYGHNAQMVYILETALAALNLPVTTYTAKLAGMCLTMDKGFVAVGTDDKMGYVKERATSTVVVWWVQAEALLGYAWLAINGGEAAATGKKRFLHVWAFVQKHFVDSVNGEWWDTLDTVDYTRSSDIKGHAWKSSYHTGRCAFILKEYCTKLAAVLAA